MQKVSTAYKESMKSALRDRGYIMISFGLINQEAQANATVDDGDFAYFSNKNNVLGEHDDSIIYATLEEDHTKVDGSNYFLPKESVGGFYDTGIVSDDLISDVDSFSITISLNILATDVKGLTINFGENYPTDFDISNDSGTVVEFRDNAESEFYTEEVFEDTTALTITVYAMKNTQSRLRIYNIKFGYGLVYYNNAISDSSLESYVSPICEDVPQIDFSVTLLNYDHYFNVDNPDSAINFLETGQEMEVYHGYELPDGSIEWMLSAHLECSEWESDDYSATIRCVDSFRTMEDEYYKGNYSSTQVSFYDLAEEVFADAGIEEYYIDPHLKVLYTKNPIPRTTHKACLQIIANACRCVLYQSRDGIPQIKSSFEPERSISVNEEETFSNIENVLNDDEKIEYANLGTDYTLANGAMYFLTSDNAGGLYTGFVSTQSGEDGTFDTNPIITVVQEAACKYYGLRMTFGHALPAAFTIRTYNDSELVDEVEVTEDIEKNYQLLYDFDDFDTMEIEFTQTENPYSRIVLNYFTFGDVTDFTMERLDMTSSPKAIKQELVKDVTVICYTYQSGTQEDTLISEEVEVESGDTITYYTSDASYGYSATIDDSSDGVSIVESGNFFVTVQYNVSGTYRLDIYGYKYTIAEQKAVVTLNERGTSITWENPMIGDMTMAQDLAEWLGEYYASRIEYEYDTRGNPEIDANDVIYQENEYVDGMKVRIYDYTLNFASAFSGKVLAKRVVEN